MGLFALSYMSDHPMFWSNNEDHNNCFNYTFYRVWYRRYVKNWIEWFKDDKS